MYEELQGAFEGLVGKKVAGTIFKHVKTNNISIWPSMLKDAYTQYIQFEKRNTARLARLNTPEKKLDLFAKLTNVADAENVTFALPFWIKEAKGNPEHKTIFHTWFNEFFQKFAITYTSWIAENFLKAVMLTPKPLYSIAENTAGSILYLYFANISTESHKPGSAYKYFFGFEDEYVKTLTTCLKPQIEMATVMAVVFFSIIANEKTDMLTEGVKTATDSTVGKYAQRAQAGFAKDPNSLIGSVESVIVEQCYNTIFQETAIYNLKVTHTEQQMTKDIFVVVKDTVFKTMFTKATKTSIVPVYVTSPHIDSTIEELNIVGGVNIGTSFIKELANVTNINEACLQFTAEEPTRLKSVAPIGNKQEAKLIQKLGATLLKRYITANVVNEGPKIAMKQTETYLHTLAEL